MRTHTCRYCQSIFAAHRSQTREESNIDEIFLVATLPTKLPKFDKTLHLSIGTKKSTQKTYSHQKKKKTILFCQKQPAFQNAVM